jgi:hypothetical protein
MPHPLQSGEGRVNMLVLLLGGMSRRQVHRQLPLSLAAMEGLQRAGLSSVHEFFRWGRCPVDAAQWTPLPSGRRRCCRMQVAAALWGEQRERGEGWPDPGLLQAGRGQGGGSGRLVRTSLLLKWPLCQAGQP